LGIFKKKKKGHIKKPKIPTILLYALF